MLLDRIFITGRTAMLGLAANFGGKNQTIKLQTALQ